MSFSLYLTHLPILVALVYLLGDRNWGLVAAVGIPIFLSVAYLFFRFVEGPSHRPANLVRRATTLFATRVEAHLRAWHVARISPASTTGSRS